MVATIRDSELSHEYEDELEEEGLGEEEWEDEGIFGTIAQGLGSLLGEGEEEWEEEDEVPAHEYEEEHGFGEAGFGEHGFGEHGFGEHGFGEAGFGEMESGEYFFKGLGRILKRVARVAAPMVLSAVGGPLGGVLGKVATSALGEGELEDEMGAHEYEDELEFEDEAGMHEYEAVLSAPMGEAEAFAELMAAVASGAQTEAEAEAMIGAATITALSPRERRELRRVLAHLVRGSAILTRLLRRRRPPPGRACDPDHRARDGPHAVATRRGGPADHPQDGGTRDGAADEAHPRNPGRLPGGRSPQFGACQPCGRAALRGAPVARVPPYTAGVSRRLSPPAAALLTHEPKGSQMSIHEMELEGAAPVWRAAYPFGEFEGETEAFFEDLAEYAAGGGRGPAAAAATAAARAATAGLWGSPPSGVPLATFGGGAERGIIDGEAEWEISHEGFTAEMLMEHFGHAATEAETEAEAEAFLFPLLPLAAKALMPLGRMALRRVAPPGHARCGRSDAEPETEPADQASRPDDAHDHPPDCQRRRPGGAAGTARHAADGGALPVAGDEAGARRSAADGQRVPPLPRVLTAAFTSPFASSSRADPREHRRRKSSSRDATSASESAGGAAGRTGAGPRGRSQALNSTRHAAALRPFSRIEFGNYQRPPQRGPSPGRERAHLLAPSRASASQRAGAGDRRGGAARSDRCQLAATPRAQGPGAPVGPGGREDLGLLLRAVRPAAERGSATGCWPATGSRSTATRPPTSGVGAASRFPAPPPFSYMRTGFSPATFRRGIPLRGSAGSSTRSR